MKFNKDTIIAVLASALTTLMLVTFISPRQTTVVVRDTPATPRVAVSGMMPGFGSDDPDWWQHVPLLGEEETQNEKEVYKILQVETIHDGDTFDVVLDWNQAQELETVRIRLAGVNCPERFDQVGWLPALKKAESFFDTTCLNSVDWEKCKNEEDEMDKAQFYFENIGDVTYGRLVGFVFYYNKEGEKVDLGYELVNEGFALPCFGYLKRLDDGDVMFNRYLIALDCLWKDITNDNKNNNKYKWMIWGPRNDDIIINLLPYGTNCNGCEKLKYYSGDKIQIRFKDDQVVDLSGCSIIDESSRAQNRFFFPEIELESKKNANILIYSGQPLPEGDRQYWQSLGEERNKNYMMSKTNIINNDFDTIFIRDVDRRIVAFAFWDSTAGENGEFKQAYELLSK
ncbi:MAG TPA: hypothetical protein PKV16_04080 [Caldisericia bacterium]|nr:hypothetical protein [Caldisericia bacterium]HPF48489.1 hypothetical protein [Caldisericia bacterium]HPI83331.1 hypothetical protein [Caldisericia bacterium]HPQ92943.1 hypothetical protein [Caldisericia bacterium]HRV73959.1 hypothetical protein [Caldisericia bacterium]